MFCKVAVPFLHKNLKR